MNHDHHHCECEHERVRFCKKCNVTHCLDCKMEWQPPCQWYHGWYWGGYTPTYTTLGSMGAAASFALQTSGGHSVDLTPTIACTH